MTQKTLNNYTLTHNQTSAMEMIDSFLCSDKSCFILKGYAGTGKTFLIKCLTESINANNKQFQLMAPTGRAARIIQEKTGFCATTIHKGIYNLDQISEIKSEGKESYKFRYNLALQPDSGIIYIIDESSMIADKYSESDFFVFGSGHLLKDLIEHIAPKNNGRGNKIIFVGDPAQLPPVSDNISGALSASYLKEKYNIEAEEFELTEVVRQKEGSGIMQNASYLRDLLRAKNRNSFKLEASYPDVGLVETGKVAHLYINVNPDLSTEKSVIINYSNKSAFNNNMAVRELLFKDKYRIEIGDILMIQQNNYTYSVELFNGTLVKVLEVSPDVELKKMKSYDENGNYCTVIHKFRRLKIVVMNNGKPEYVHCLILENFLYSEKPSLTFSESVALYIDFKIRNSTLRSGTKDFLDALRRDPYFNALKVKYGYAITCHKAQGGEWDSVFVNMDVSMGLLCENFLRWTYTSITRASSNLNLFNLPRVNQFSKLKFNFAYIEMESGIIEPAKILQVSLSDDYLFLLEKLELSNARPFIRDKFTEIYAKISHRGILVRQRKAHNFQEVYLFEKEDKKAGIAFWYNGKNEFTKQTVVPNMTSDNLFADEISNLMNNQITIQLISEKLNTFFQEDQKKQLVEFDESKQGLRVLYDNFADVLQQYEIEIIDVAHYSYQEFYSLKRANEKAALRFYYDGKLRFTSGEPFFKECNSNKLLADAYLAIAQLQKI